ncbi:MAG: hypothetical protein QXR53_00385 [Candidatus Norongarragalinales archaeon]
MGISEALHYAHALHMLHYQKEKRERKLEEKKRKLVKIKVKLKDNLDAFLQGKQARVSGLSRAFLRQALAVSEEKKKLDALKARLASAKKASFGSSLRRQ